MQDLNRPRGLSRDRFLLLTGGFATVSACSGGGGTTAITPAATVSPGGATPTPPPTASPLPSAAPTVSLAVNWTSSSGAVEKTLPGLSYEKSEFATTLFNAGNVDLQRLFALLGPSVLRIGGRTVDSTAWTPNGAGATSGQVAPADIRALDGFLGPTNWKVIYGINFLNNTPQGAAAEAKFVAETLGDRLFGFEIGNEPDLYASHGLEPDSYTLSDFVSGWKSYRSGILEAVPGALITGPAAGGYWSKFTVPFANDVAQDIGLLTQHYYRGGSEDATSTMAELLAEDPELALELPALRAASKGLSIGYRISECNSFYDDGVEGVSNAYGAALWAIDFMLRCAANSAQGVNFHGGGHHAPYGPIENDGAAILGVHPIFYGMVLAAQISPGPMYPVALSGAAGSMTAYAVGGSDGYKYVLIINKGASNQSVALNLGMSATSAQSYVMTGPSVLATTGISLAGAGIPNTGLWAPKSPVAIAVGGTTMRFPCNAASAVLLKIS